MIKYLLMFFLPLVHLQASEGSMEGFNSAPQYLYKVLSKENWVKSQSQQELALPTDDEAFIHFSEEYLVPRLIDKYWASNPDFYVIKVQTNKLEGKLVKEKNPGGNLDYYHLYNGRIPMKAVIEVKHVTSQLSGE